MCQEHLLGLFWGTPWPYFSTVISHLGKTTAIFQIVQSGHNYLCESHDLRSAPHCPSTPPEMFKTLWWVLFIYRYVTCYSKNIVCILKFVECIILYMMLQFSSLSLNLKLSLKTNLNVNALMGKGHYPRNNKLHYFSSVSFICL